MDRIPLVVYINLDRRTDRKDRIEKDLERVGIDHSKIRRFSAVELPKSNLASCNFSHAAALEFAYEMGVDEVLILEDDFTFMENVELVRICFSRLYEEVDQQTWDVINLVKGPIESKGSWPNENDPRTDSPLLHPLSDHTNAAGYLIKRSAIPALVNAIRSAAYALHKTGHHWVFANDIVWQQFQRSGRWFRFPLMVGWQKMSFSDLSGRVVEYIG